MRIFFVSVAVTLLLMGSTTAMAQTGMTDAQVIQYVQEGLSQGKSQQQLMMELSAKGVTTEQALRLKQMYENGEISTESTQTKTVTDTSRMRESTEANKAEETPKQESAPAEAPAKVNPLSEMVYGRNIFTNDKLSFEPDLNMATPQNYRLGPGDEIIIDIWGASEDIIRKEISPDGSINVPGLGVISLNGMNIADAKEYLKSELSKIYADEGNQIQVTLGKTRSIKINVMGEVMVPGTYTLSAFASVFHALYSAGGVTDLGSLRNI